MDDDGVLTELRRMVLVEPVVVTGEVALLRDPELDGVVLHLEEVKPRRPQHSDQQRDQDHWHRIGGGPDSEPEGKFEVRGVLELHIKYNFTSGRIPQTSRQLSLSLVN